MLNQQLNQRKKKEKETPWKLRKPGEQLLQTTLKDDTETWLLGAEYEEIREDLRHLPNIVLFTEL